MDLWGEWPGASPGKVFGLLVALVLGALIGPARVAGQVVTGVGFLCAGVILHQGATVRGLNTAATVWCCSAVGVLAGLGLNAWAVSAAALVLAANIILHLFEHRLYDSTDK